MQGWFLGEPRQENPRIRSPILFGAKLEPLRLLEPNWGKNAILPGIFVCPGKNSAALSKRPEQMARPHLKERGGWGGTADLNS